MFDVIVVGAGPGGTCAAYELARRGLRTLVLESKRVPGVPVRCGELVRPSSIIPEDVRSLISPIATIPSCAITSASGTRVTFTTPDPGVLMRRDEFDALLFERAIRAGADVKLEHHVENVTIDNERVEVVAEFDRRRSVYYADHIIAADGVGGRVSRALGLLPMMLPREIAVTATTRISMTFPPLAEIVLDAEVAPGGYAWVFSDGKGSVNVGVGLNPTLACGIAATQYLRSFVMHRFGMTDGFSVVHGAIPATAPPESVASRFCTAVGDAGRFVNPVTGAGIALAVNTGTYAGRLLFDGRDYNKWVRSTYSEPLLRSLAVRRVLDAAPRQKLADAVVAAAERIAGPISVSAAFSLIAKEL